MESAVYNQSGEKVGKVTLPDKVFNVPFNNDTVHEVITSMRANARAGTAHTKDRSAVSGGGKKPWKQKGTGRARHGSRRSPLWRGGGVTFGPTNERNFACKINKKVKTKALFMLISQKLRDGEILFLDSIDAKDAKTKHAKTALQNISALPGLESLKTKKRNAALIFTPERNMSVERSFNNFGNIFVAPITAMNPIAVATYKYVIVTDPEKSISFLESKMKNKPISKK